MNIIAGLRDLWCEYTHGGGHILRDPSGQINWSCMKCGRWAIPVSSDDEAKVVDGAIAAQAANNQGSGEA